MKIPILLCTLLTGAIAGPLAGQVTDTVFPTEGGTVMLAKQVPLIQGFEIYGDGKPVEQYFFVQLARFEMMDSIPAQFPKGTLLWLSPDHPTEKVLMAGFYSSHEEALIAAQYWRQFPEFMDAYVRRSPLFIRYD